MLRVLLVVLVPLASTLAARAPAERSTGSSAALPGGAPIRTSGVPTFTVVSMDTLSDEHVVGTAHDLDPAFAPDRPGEAWRLRSSRSGARGPVLVGGSFTDFVPLGPDVSASFVHAVGWSDDGAVWDLGVRSVSEAHGMNARGTVVGYVGDRAFRHARGAWRLLPSVGYGRANATAVNASGVVVGYETRGWGRSKALYWTADDGVHELALGSAELSDVNDDDVAVGYRSSGAAIRVDLGSGVPTVLPAPLAGSPCWAEAINAAGEAVGEFSLQGALQPVLWSREGRAIPLPVLPDEGSGGARATDINAHGVIVGSSNWGKAVVWWIDGSIYDLNELTPDYAPFLKNARAINDHGVIACESDAGATRAVLLVPDR